MKDKIKNAFIFSFVVFIITFFLASFTEGFFYNPFIWGMIIVGIIATGIFAYFYKKSKPVYILFYILALISIYLIGGYFYTQPFLFVHLNIFYTNHFHYHFGYHFALYNGTYVPYNLSLYEPVYTLFPFQTKVPNLINQTITIKLSTGGGFKNYIIEAKYKVINESIVPKYSFNYYCSNPVYVLELRPEVTNPQIINMFNETTFIENVAGWVSNEEYNGIIIGQSIGDGPFAENSYGC